MNTKLNKPEIKKLSSARFHLGLYKGSAAGFHLFQQDNGSYVFSFDEEEIIDFTAFKTLLKSMGVQIIHGPINGSSWYSYRLNPDSKSHFLGDLESDKQKHELLLSQGLKVSHLYFSALSDQVDLIFLAEKEKEIKNSDYNLVHLNDSKEHLELIHDLCHREFLQNPFFQPISFQEFEEIMRPKINDYSKKYSLLLLDPNRQLMGFVFSYPDPQQKQLVIKSLAQHSLFKGQSWGRYLTLKSSSLGRNDSLKDQIHAHIYAGNKNCKTSSEAIGAKLLTEYYLYEWVL